MSVESAVKIFIIHQSQKILILLEQSEIPRLHCLSSRYPNKKKQIKAIHNWFKL